MGEKKHEKKDPEVWPCTLYMHLSIRFLGSDVLFMQILSFFLLLYACDVPENSLCPRISNSIFVDTVERKKKYLSFALVFLPLLGKFIFYTYFHIRILMWMSLDPSLVWLEFIL